MASAQAQRLEELRRASTFVKDFNQLWSKGGELDQEVDDDLARAQKQLNDLKHKISVHSKQNFALEKDVRYLDSRIALLINHRISFEELADQLEDNEPAVAGSIKDDRKRQHYGNLFFMLQTRPSIMASLGPLVSLADIDSLLQTIMFTLYGNQYESREEHLLLQMFETALEHDFNTATEMAGLLRANTAVSRMMTTYTRRGPGQEYLKTCLSQRIQELIQSRDLNLEIDPAKIYEQMINDIETQTGQTCELPRVVSYEDAAANADVQKILQPRIDKLCEVTEAFLSTVVGSLENIPYGIRWLCKKIRSLMKQKYPEATEENFLSLVGGFYLLRFVNPAIVTPHSFMLIADKPSRSARRNLTLVAKLLQNLANKPNFKKEPYLTPLSEFTQKNAARLQSFLDKICDVEDFYDAVELDKYMYLSRKDLTINITLNEIYNVHSQLHKHIGELCADKSDHLCIILNDLGPAPEQLPRKDNRTVSLQLFSRWEEDAATDGPNDSRPGSSRDSRTVDPTSLLQVDTKALGLRVLRALRGVPPPTIDTMIAATQKSTNQWLVRMGQNISENVKSMSDQGFKETKALYDEIKLKFEGLPRLKEKVDGELKSLQNVYKNIVDHNNYLRQQLDAYKVYLQNVRSQAGSGTTLKSKDRLARGTTEHKRLVGPVRFNHVQLEKEGVIIESDVPENRRNNIYFNFSSPEPGLFVIALFYKGRDKAIVEMSLNLEDLLEKQHDNLQHLDLEYVQLNVNKTLHLLNKTFLKE
eukprot:Opistho-2@15132